MKLAYFLVLSALAATLCSCSDSTTYRYKLTLSVDTPDGVKTGSSVCEETLEAVSMPENGGIPTVQFDGEAVYVDLGRGKRPLIALLGRYLSGLNPNWSHDYGPSIPFVLSLYGFTPSRNDIINDAKAFAKLRGPRPMNPADLPDLVTFTDVNDPNTVTLVDPRNLSATLGAGIRWRSITIEGTDEPVTHEILKYLPWIPSYYDKLLDGRLPGQKHGNTLSAKLSTATFAFRLGSQK